MLSNPPRRNSLPLIRIPSAKSSPAASRIRVSASTTKRIRSCGPPPHLSVRLVRHRRQEGIAQRLVGAVQLDRVRTARLGDSRSIEIRLQDSLDLLVAELVRAVVLRTDHGDLRRRPHRAQVRELHDGDRAGVVHLANELLHPFVERGVLIRRLMGGEAYRQADLVRTRRRKREVQEPSLAADPAGSTARFGRVVRDEVVVDLTRDLRRVDGVGGLANPVGHQHRSNLNRRKEMFEFHFAHFRFPRFPRSLTRTKPRRSARQDDDRKGAIRLLLEMGPDREEPIQLRPQGFALLLGSKACNRLHLAIVELDPAIRIRLDVETPGRVAVVARQRSDHDHLLTILQEDEGHRALLPRFSPDGGQQQSRQSRRPLTSSSARRVGEVRLDIGFAVTLDPLDRGRLVQNHRPIFVRHEVGFLNLVAIRHWQPPSSNSQTVDFSDAEVLTQTIVS